MDITDIMEGDRDVNPSSEPEPGVVNVSPSNEPEPGAAYDPEARVFEVESETLCATNPSKPTATKKGMYARIGAIASSLTSNVNVNFRPS